MAEVPVRAGKQTYGEKEMTDYSQDNLQVATAIPDHSQADGHGTKSVLVTGGAGYVGSVLVRQLLEANYRVVCLDNLRFGGQSLVDIWGHPRFTFRKADVTDHDDIDRIIDADEYFAIVHLAAIVGDPACGVDPELAQRVNGEASMHLLERALDSGIPRFIFASTCSNYGKMDVSDGYVDEQAPLRPVSLYARLKVEFEDVILNRMERREDFCPTSLRFATVYGVSPRMRFDLTINEFTRELAFGKELAVFGEQFWRPYCHVRDVARAVLTVLNAPAAQVAYDVFNVGDTEENYTKKMIVDELLRQIPNGRVKYVKRDEDPRDYRVRFEKIRDHLGFRISKTVPAGIKDVLTSLRLGIIEDPESQRYHNIAVNS